MSSAPLPATAAAAGPGSSTATETDAVVAAVLTCPAVAGMHSSGVGQFATYLPGRRVEGVRIGENGIEIAVVLAAGAPVLAADQQVRAAVAPLAAGRPVHIHVGDVQLPAEEQLALPAPT